MSHFILSFIFLLFLCVPVHAQATAGPESGAGSTSSPDSAADTQGTVGGDFTTGSSAGTLTTENEGNFTTENGRFTTQNESFTTDSGQPDTLTTSPQLTTRDENFIAQTESQINSINSRIQGIRQRQSEVGGTIDQTANEELMDLSRRQEALQNDLSQARESGNIGLNSQSDIENELRELDREITRMERGL